MPSHAPPAAFVAVVLTLAILLAGCLGPPAGTPTSTSSPAGTPTATGSPGTTSKRTTGTPAGTEYASRQPEPSRPVTVRNGWNRSVEVHVSVVRETTNGTVHEATYDLPAGTERTVYDTAEAEPDGIERFTVTVSARNATESVTIETSRCYGDVYAETGSDGELFVTYAVC